MQNIFTKIEYNESDKNGNYWQWPTRCVYSLQFHYIHYRKCYVDIGVILIIQIFGLILIMNSNNLSKVTRVCADIWSQFTWYSIWYVSKTICQKVPEIAFGISVDRVILFNYRNITFYRNWIFGNQIPCVMS